jgi:hypothetical protein
VEIQDSNNKNKEGVGAVHKFIQATTQVGETMHKNHIEGGASTYGKSTTLGSIILSIRFGNLTSICAKK